MGRLQRTALAILRNKEDAEDAVQDALCRAYIRLQSFQGKSSLSTWLTRIVINSALMIRRRRNGRQGRYTAGRDSRGPNLERPQLQNRSINGTKPRADICRINEVHGLLGGGNASTLPPRLREGGGSNCVTWREYIPPQPQVKSLVFGWYSAFKSLEYLRARPETHKKAASLICDTCEQATRIYS